MTGNITMAMLRSTMGITNTIPVIAIGVDASMFAKSATGGMPNPNSGLMLNWARVLHIHPMVH